MIAGSPSSTIPSQSSSSPLHVSGGGEQANGSVQLMLQTRVPMLPQVVVHATVAPRQHAKVSSHIASQSSSAPLQVSAGGVQPPGTVQADEQVRVPIVPQLVMHASVVPAQQPKPSSQAVSQSSSAPLQISAGGVQLAGTVQLVEHVREPVLPQLVVHERLEPRQHAKPSSHIVSQSSSAPLQVSAGGLHVPHPQLPLQSLVPVEPQL